MSLASYRAAPPCDQLLLPYTKAAGVTRAHLDEAVTLHDLSYRDTSRRSGEILPLADQRYHPQQTSMVNRGAGHPITERVTWRRRKMSRSMNPKTSTAVLASPLNALPEALARAVEPVSEELTRCGEMVHSLRIGPSKPAAEFLN